MRPAAIIPLFLFGVVFGWLLGHMQAAAQMIEPCL